MFQAIFDRKSAPDIVSTTKGRDPLANNLVVPGWLDNGDRLAFLYQWVYPGHPGTIKRPDFTGRQMTG
jgi:hypothetical protein